MKFYLVVLMMTIAKLSFGQLDSLYVQPSPYYKTVALHSTLKDFKLSFSSAADKVVLQNSNLGLGFRLRYKNLGFSFSLPIVSFNISDSGTPKAFGFGFNLFPSVIFLQGTFQRIKGFDNLSGTDGNSDPIFQPNSKMIFASLTGNYAFNHKRFSLSSAFKMINLQKKSAGSWIFSVPINYQSFSTDSLSLSIENQPDFQFGKYRSIKLGLGGGYAYTKVWGSYSATIFAVGGAEFRQLRYSDIPTEKPRRDFLISPTVRLVSSVLYNTPSSFCGIVGHYLPSIDVADGINTRIQNIRVRLIYGRRF